MEFLELQQIVESNSRAIQAMLDAQASDRLQREEFREELRQVATSTDAAIIRIDEAIRRLTTLNEGVVNMLGSLDEDRPTVLRKLNAIERKVDRLLGRENGNNEGSQT